MNLFLFISVALAVILEAHICWAGCQTNCGKNFENEVGENCESTLPEGTTFYFDECGFLKYCSSCRHIHLAYLKSLSSWLKTLASCVCFKDFWDEEPPEVSCRCECHTYSIK